MLSPPIVHSMTPATGLWGTQVTIDGANFGVIQGAGVVAFSSSVGAHGFVLDTWTDTEIRGRIAFPGTGLMSVHTAAGEGEAGTFTTTQPYTPSAYLDVAQLVDGLVLSTGEVAALHHEYELTNQATLSVFGGSDRGAYPLAQLVDPANPTSPMIARLVEADDHTPLVIATRRDQTVVALGVQGAALVTTATGLTGNVVAAARDATGLYAWIDTGAGIVRARPGATWTVDRGPIATTYPALDGAIVADGTLWIAVSEPGPSNTAYVSLEVLPPTGTLLGPPERADPVSYPNAISVAHVVLGADGIHALVVATADVSGPLPPRLRTAAVTWSDAPAVTGLVQYAFVGTTLAAIVNDAQAKTTSLVPDVAMPSGAQVIPVWPLQSEGFVVDGAGKAHPLITNGTVTYALTPQP